MVSDEILFVSNNPEASAFDPLRTFTPLELSICVAPTLDVQAGIEIPRSRHSPDRKILSSVSCGREFNPRRQHHRNTADIKPVPRVEHLEQVTRALAET
jgi:hypothetical protein